MTNIRTVVESYFWYANSKIAVHISRNYLYA